MSTPLWPDGGEMTGGAPDSVTTWRVPPPAWYLRAGRAAGAALAGALVGAAVAGIWHAGMAASNRACQGVANSFCVGFIVPPIAAIAGNVLLIIAGVWIGFAALRITPLRLTVPAGFIVAVLLVWDVSFGTGDVGTGPPVWAAALAMGSGLAALALAADHGRPQKAGIIALGAIILASIILPRVL